MLTLALPLPGARCPVVSGTDNNFLRLVKGRDGAGSRWVDPLLITGSAPLCLHYWSLAWGCFALGQLCCQALQAHNSLYSIIYSKNNNIAPVKGLKKKKSPLNHHPSSTAALNFLSCSSLRPYVFSVHFHTLATGMERVGAQDSASFCSVPVRVRHRL